MLRLADANGCKLGPDFKQRTMDDMSKPNLPESIMWQDYVARRPMEIETYLGSPIKLARESKVSVPRIETLYAILHNLNIVNRSRPKPGDVPPPASLMPPSSPASSPQPRVPSQAGHRPMVSGVPNGNGVAPRQPRPRNSSNFGPPGMRRPPPQMNGGPPPNGYPRPPPSMNGGSRVPSRRGSMDGNDLEEFSHLVLYDDIPEGSEPSLGGDLDVALRERQLRQRELALREQEMRMRRGPPGPPGPRRGPHPMRNSQQVFDDDDDDDDFLDPMTAASIPTIDPDNFDMMSVTSRKNRKAPGPSASQFRRNPEPDGPPPPRASRFRPSMGRNRASQVNHLPAMTDNILDDPMLAFTSNRYGAVDRGAMGGAMGGGSRANSLTASRLDDLQYGPGPGGPPPATNGAHPRRASQSPGNPYGPPSRGGRPSPPNGYAPSMNGRPSPPDGVRQPVPRYPPGQGNSIGPQQVEQHVGVSALHPPKPRNVRSLTGSASASVGSGEIDSERSAHSSQSSLQNAATIGVR